VSGGYYIALTGLRARLDAVDRLASDLANASTVGYKSERATTVESDRPSFDSALQSAIDVTDGPTRVDLRSGSIAPTGRDLDVAIDGSGFFTIETAGGVRYTRDGRFTRRADGVLTTMEGNPVLGTGGHIVVPNGPVTVDALGNVRSGSTMLGTISVVDFDSSTGLVKEGAFRFRNDGATPHNAENAELRSGALEQSNVSTVERIAELTTAMRNFETLQKAISVLSNDVDARAISELGRR
jgi:flagellar basal-body rod protein FlgF